LSEGAPAALVVDEVEGPLGVEAPGGGDEITVATTTDPLVTDGATVAAGVAVSVGAASGADAELPAEAISSMALASAARTMACT
jgi:hypothetical protein